MAEKRYFWLKLKDDIFSSRRIKKLRRLENGDTLFVIYLKMQLLAMKHEGKLVFTGLEDSMEEELALDLDEDTEMIRTTLDFLLKQKLAEQMDESIIFLPWAMENTGSEGASAERMRNKRERERNEASLFCSTRTEQSANNVEQCAQTVTESKNKRKSQIQSQTTESDAREDEPIYPENKALFLAFCQQKGIADDFASSFFDRYAFSGWRDGNGNPIRNWQHYLFEAWQSHKIEQPPSPVDTLTAIRERRQREAAISYTPEDLEEWPKGSGLYRLRTEVEAAADG